MSAYQLNKAVYDHLRGRGAEYDLSSEESAAFLAADVKALYSLGLHPVLLNAFARAKGLQRTDYRALLEGADGAESLTPRWRSAD